MENFNWLPVIVASFIPMIVGGIYYGPVMGKVWMNSLGFTEDDLKGGNLVIMYGVALLLSFFLSFGINLITELVHKDVNDAGELIFASFHTFKHGAFHGFFLGLMMAVPVIVTNSIFQRNTAKNILINVLYWLITFTLMGGLLDAWN